MIGVRGRLFCGRPFHPSDRCGMTRFGAFYFSFVTLSTVGYGDITPVSKVARMLAVTKAITGMLTWPCSSPDWSR